MNNLPCKICGYPKVHTFHRTYEECMASSSDGFGCYAPEDHHQYTPGWKRYFKNIMRVIKGEFVC